MTIHLPPEWRDEHVPQETNWPSGWWILPCVVIGAILWALIFAAIKWSLI